MNVSSQPTVYAWRPACWLRATGTDASEFLQGQFTNDLKTSSSGAVYGLWLNLKGKVLADSFVVREVAVGDEYWIGSYFSPAVTIQSRLESHIIADDVSLEDQTAAWSAVSVIGAGAAERVASARATAGGAGFTLPGRRTRGENVDWLFPAAAAETAGAALGGLPTATAVDVERWRIAARIPAVPRDAGPADLPNEAGLEADAISYTKGCYLGQEVMARLKSMGQVRRRLLGVRSALPPPDALPRPLFAGPRQVGELRSAAVEPGGGFVGLALLSLLHVTANSRLAFTADGDPSVALLDRP